MLGSGHLSNNLGEEKEQALTYRSIWCKNSAGKGAASAKALKKDWEVIRRLVLVKLWSWVREIRRKQKAKRGRKAQCERPWATNKAQAFPE